MANNDDLPSILRRYVQLEEATLAELTSELQTLPGPRDAQRLEAKDRVLRTIELHAQADLLVEDAVGKYREDLYFLSRRLAEEDLEAGVVTRAHVRQAQSLLARHRRVSTWGDALLTVGSLFVGAAIPHLFELAKRSVSPNILIVAGGLVGALLLGMGVVEKMRH